MTDCGPISTSLVVAKLGLIFGRLRVVAHAGSGFLACRCTCGELTLVQSHTLFIGGTRSCGCLRAETCGTANKRHINWVGRRFGQLTVTAGIKTRLWQCQCDCGNMREAWAANLRSGDTWACVECTKSTAQDDFAEARIGKPKTRARALSRKRAIRARAKELSGTEKLQAAE
jgi:hypothetical protein